MEEKEIWKWKATPNSTAVRKLRSIILVMAQNANQQYSVKYNTLSVYR